MRPELEEIRLLEDYLHDNLPEEQHQHVSVRLLWDWVWQRNLAAQQTAYRALKLAGRRQLRQELESIHARLFG